MKNRVLFLLLLMLGSYAAKSQTYTYLGQNAGNGTSTDLTAVGYKAGDVSTGSWNAFFGANSGKVNTTGGQNTFLGADCGNSNTTGTGNTFVGMMSGLSMTTGSNNTFLGSNSAKFNAGAGNTILGASAGLYSTGVGTGANNLFVGFSSGQKNENSNNTFLGTQSGRNNISGANNVFLGYQAGYNELGSSKLYIENSSAATPLIYGDFSADRVGVNSLPVTTNGVLHTLSVGGTIHATGIYVNGVSLSDGGFEFWTKAGNNVWNNTGNVGIGTPLTSNPNNYKLAVNGKLGAKEVQIENSSWPDFVFLNEYKLMTLPELEGYIKQNGHLPEIPSAKEVEENGILVGEMNAKLLQKVEELTLYIIELEKKLEAIDKKIGGN